MATRRPGFPRLNLAKEHVTDIGISWSWERSVDRSVPEQLTDLFREDLYFSITDYRRSNTPHVIVERLDASNPDQDVQASIHYEQGSHLPTGRVPDEMNRGEEFFDRLVLMTEPVTVKCAVDFDVPFERGERTGLWFPLPVPLSSSDDDPNAPVSEIRGVRGVKIAETDDEQMEQLAHSFILDRPTNSNVSLSVNFSIRSAITEQTPNDVMAKARDIARRLGLS